MTRADFVDHAARLGIRLDAYDLESLRDESYVLAREHHGFTLFYHERGLRTGVQTFRDEPVALAALLDRLAQDRTTRA